MSYSLTRLYAFRAEKVPSNYFYVKRPNAEKDLSQLEIIDNIYCVSYTEA